MSETVVDDIKHWTAKHKSARFDFETDVTFAIAVNVCSDDPAKTG